MSSLFTVEVDGAYVTGQSHTVSGGHYPVLEEQDMKYAKLYKTYHEARGCFNKIEKLWPDRYITITEIELKPLEVIKSN